ncbi:Mu transposase C-terminal domain-containing protein [Streptacidiphilus sp. EB129]|uniref:Mu transposase C-terminal domain-containing protein n=1 Tax=Streptacidiphilus sp. EB129 TaxID=3156262 RepID=UPI003519403E
MGRLLALDARGELSTDHARLVAVAAGVSLRTVWRWLEAAREGRSGPVTRERFTLTADLHARLVRWCGNTAAVHRELVAEARAGALAGGGDEAVVASAVAGVVSLATLQRAVLRDLNPGQRAALQGGERARRRHDVHLRRPRRWRNACWEGDHTHVPVEVDLEGELVCPWVTWFVDCATGAVAGAAVSAHQPSRDGVLAALRIALTRFDAEGVYGPIGGLPSLVRVDRGRDFLSRTVGAALGAFAVPVQDLPAYRPELKGTVENLNRCAERMLFVSLPRYRHAPTAAPRRRARDRDPTPPLAFTVFVQLLLDWVRWWNTEHTSQALAGRTPLQAWEADPTPIEDVPADQLAMFTLEGDGRTRALTGSGVRWRGRYYVGAWMTGYADAGTRVRIRYVPHHDREIEVFDAVTGSHLGTAHLADEATGPERAALRCARGQERRRQEKALAASARDSRERFAAMTTATLPERLRAVTAEQAAVELASRRAADLAARALPDLIPPREPPASWARPIRRRVPGTGTGVDTGRGDAPAAPSASAPESRHVDKDTDQ